jgi:CRISPR-associated endonuclease Csn1
MKNYRLGLDLGTNSIGFALLELDQEQKPFQIIKTGVRIFSDGRNPKDKTPLSVERTTARGMRRMRDRKLARKKSLLNFLIQNEFLPKSEKTDKNLEKLNPYFLRNESFSRQLSLFEISRIFFHIVRRRGFKSNRKEMPKDEKKQTETTKNRFHESGLTLGQYLYQNYILKNESVRNQDGLENRDATRKLYEEEFDKIIEFQTKFYPEIKQEIWAKIKNIIFFQRDLKAQEKGVCRFLNKFNQENLPQNLQNLIPNDKKGLERAYLSLPSYNQFRILSEVDNLRIINKIDRSKRKLTDEERKNILEILNETQGPKFEGLIKKLKLNKDEFYFNLHTSARDKIQGNKTEIEMRKSENFGEDWDKFDLKTKDEIILSLFDDKEEQIYQKAKQNWGLDDEKANYFAKEFNLSKLKQGVGNLSKEILQILVPQMQDGSLYNQVQDGSLYNQACEKIGIKHSEIKTDGSYEKLEYYGKVLQASVVSVKNGGENEVKYGKIANPTVHVALNQLQKVVNDLIKDYGKPAQIVVELARELGKGAKEINEITSQQAKNKKENKRLDKRLEEFNVAKNYENRLKLKLFEELDKAGGGVACCAFSGEVINSANLFNGEVQIEHILPLSRTFDDSFANKTLAYAWINKEKGNRSPFEAFGGDEKRYQQILAFSQNLPKNKAWRFGQNAMERFADQNDFIARQLNDTRYLSRLSKQYLGTICKNIFVANGRLTSVLRHNWGLNSILEKINFNKEAGEVIEDKKQEDKPKKNRDDHRHHAIDALVVALTDHSTLQKASKENKRYGKTLAQKFEIEAPWQNFRNDVQKSIDEIVVSHKVDHGKNTKLHDETYYGSLKKRDKNKNYNIIVKRKISEIENEKHIFEIKDEKIREDLNLIYQNNKGDDGKLRENDFKSAKENYAKKHGMKSIKCYDTNQSIIKFFHGKDNNHQKITKTNGNSHIAVWRMPDKKIKIETITNFQMNSLYKIERGEDGINFVNKDKKIKIKNNKDPYEAIFNHLKPHPAAKLLARIFGGDKLIIEKQGKKQTVIVKIIGSKNEKTNKDGQCTFLESNLIILDSNKGRTFKINEDGFRKNKIRKIFVSPSGKVYDNGPIL